MMNTIFRFVLSAVLLAVVSRIHAAEPVKVLLIGNSYTAGAKPGIELFLAGAGDKYWTSYITPGGRRLMQHAANEKTVQKIAAGGWDYVVLQEQSQIPSLPAMKEQFTQGGEKLSTTAKAAGAKVLLYSTWGRKDGDKRNKELNPDYETMQHRLDKSYAELARRTGAKVVPVGDAWRRVKQQSPGLFAKLYASDGSHPSTHGSFLTGAVFFKALTGRAATMPGRIPAKISRAEAETLLKAAQKPLPPPSFKND